MTELMQCRDSITAEHEHYIKTKKIQPRAV